MGCWRSARLSAARYKAAEGGGEGSEVARIVVKVMIDAQGQINHLHGCGNDFGTAAEARENMADVAVVLLDGEGQIFAGEELILWNEAVKPFPIVGQEGFALDPNFIEELLTEPAPWAFSPRT